jgi:outer membrane biosynthesis protein TonB
LPYDKGEVSRNFWLTTSLVLGAAAIWWAVLWGPAKPDATEPDAEEPAAIAPDTEQPAAAVPTPPASPPPHDDHERTTPTAPPANAPSAEASPAPTAPPPQQAAPTAPDQIPAPERTGPVDQRKAAFESEPRDSNASEPESAIQAAFRRPEVPSGMVKSVLCRRSVCKVETRWTPAGAAGFMGALMHLVASPEGAANRKFEPEIAVAPEDAPDTNGERSIDVYLKRLD